MKYIAFCTKGLEKIAADEITEKVAGVIEEVADKRIVFTSDSTYEELSSLLTVDDLALFVSKSEKITSLKNVEDQLRKIDFTQIKNTLCSYRSMQTDVFSLTITAAKSSFQLLQAKPSLCEVIENITHWQYLEKDHTKLDIRLFLDGKALFIAARLTPESLSKRQYKTVALPGSLKPTVASCMIRMLGQTDGKKLIDTFCGSGSILCEAVLQGYSSFGSDINPESIATTKINLSHLTAIQADQLKVQSATDTSWPEHFFDVSVSNLPWDKQIGITSITDLYHGSLTEYARILKENAILCLLVSKPELLIKHAKKIFPHSTISSTTIGLLGQNPTIVRIQR